MEYLLVMSLSGSTMTGIYLIFKCLLKDKVSARLYYLVTRAAVLFYLIPLPFLKGWYRKITRFFVPARQIERIQIPVRWTNTVMYVGSKVYVNNYAIVQMIVAGVWLLIVSILMVRWVWKYVRIRQQIDKYKGTVMTWQQKSFLEGLKKQYGVRWPVILYQGRDGEPTITFGICRPVIICNREIGSREAEMLVSHEMVHIRRMDVLWKLFVRFVVMLHWWNPIVRKLRREFERACEYSCDEIAMQTKTREEVKEYLRLLISEASETMETGTTFMGWQNGFADDVEDIKERMANLLKKKKWNRYMAGVLVAALTFCNSMTVFAYRDTFYQEMMENTPQEAIVGSLRSDTTCFTPDGVDNDFRPLQGIEILYEKQFIDTEGNIYPYSDEETMTAYGSCSHVFVSGTTTEHIKKPGGGCGVREYRAQRCSKCGYVVQGERIGVYAYDVCPH